MFKHCWLKPIMYWISFDKRSVMLQKRYQYISRQGKEWTRWFETNDDSEQWQLKNKLKNEYREVSVKEISPGDVIGFMREHGLDDEKTEKKVLKHLEKFSGMLKSYSFKGGKDTENAEKAIALCKHIDDKLKELAIEFIKNL